MRLDNLPDAALAAAVDALSCKERAALRACCRRIRAAVNARTQEVGSTPYAIMAS